MFRAIFSNDEKEKEERIALRTKQLEQEAALAKLEKEKAQRIEDEQKRKDGYKQNQQTGEWVFCGPIIDLARRAGYESVSDYIASIGGFQKYPGLVLMFKVQGREVLSPNYC